MIFHVVFVMNELILGFLGTVGGKEGKVINETNFELLFVSIQIGNLTLFSSIKNDFCTVISLSLTYKMNLIVKSLGYRNAIEILNYYLV